MNYETLKNNINKSLENYEKTKDEEHLADIVRTLNAYGYPLKRSVVHETAVSDEYFRWKFGRFDRRQGKYYRDYQKHGEWRFFGN